MRKKIIKYIPADIYEPIEFNNSKLLEWYWDCEIFHSKEATISITLLGPHDERPEKLEFQLTYIDTSKRLIQEEYIDRIMVDIPVTSTKTKYVSKVAIQPKIGNKVLWKIGAKAITKKKRTVVFFSIV